MGNITAFRTREQKEYDKISARSEGNLTAYEEMMAKKQRKLDLGGSLTDADINEIIAGMEVLARDSRERREQLKKIDPERVEQMEELDKKNFKDAKEKFYEEEFGLKIIK